MKSLPQQIIDRLKLKVQRPNPQKIISVTFAVTYLCNSKCKMCNIWKKYKTSPNKKSTELKLNEIRDTFTNSEYLRNLQRVNFTGGEPFLRKDFVELCGFFVKNYPKAEICIATNALNSESIISSLEEIESQYGPKNITVYISLDGKEATHEKMRGVAGAYSQVLKLIQLLKERLPSVEQGITFTITPDNYKELPTVYELTKKLDVDFGTVFAQTSQAFYENDEMRFEWDAASLSYLEKVINVIVADGGRSKRRVPRILREIDGVELCYLANMVRYMRYRQRIHKCYSGTHSFFMDPYGNIFPCIMLNKKMGNIAESNFNDIWTSITAQQVRESIKGEKCACWTPCEVGLSLLRNPNVILFNSPLRRRRIFVANYRSM